MGLCLLVGATGAALSAGSARTWYATLHQPPGTPPDWAFGVVWTTLYVIIGISAWIVWRERGPGRDLQVWGWQLAANALWAPAFFGLHQPALAIAVMAALLGLVALTIMRFARVRRAAAWLMVPYGIWCCYATWLTIGFWWLNTA